MKGRVTMLPDSLIAPLQGHSQRVKRLHEGNLARDYGSVCLPYPSGILQSELICASVAPSVSKSLSMSSMVL
jgi:hypothetical protein